MIGSGVVFETAIARARALAAEMPATRELLAFYASLLDYQRTLAAGVPDAGDADAAFAAAVDTPAAAAAVPAFLAWIGRNAPPALAREAGRLRGVPVERWQRWMGDALGGTGRIEPADAVRDFVVEAVLQPFAECAAAPRRGRLRAGHGPDCPVCGRPASAGVLREEGHGAKRTLWCGLCLTEWDYQRLVCVACDEQRFDALPVYTADAYAVARIEGCDTCHTYLKTIDLTKTGVAVPMVDDLATLPMDLWARQSGYNRLRSHLLGA